MAPGTEESEPMVGLAEPVAAGHWAAALIRHRQTVLPKRLVAPGPDADRLDLILRAAGAAPDHGELVPWRFVVIPDASRPRLADVFAASLIQRDPSATADQVAQARDKASRAPFLMLAIARTGTPSEEIPACERLVSAGCAIQNVLLMATALGFSSALTSGKAVRSDPMRLLFALETDEECLCFISIGTATLRKPERPRPEPSRYVSFLSAQS